MKKVVQDLKLKLFYCFQSQPGNEDILESRIKVSKKVVIVQSRGIKQTHARAARRATKPGLPRDPGPQTG